MNTEKKNQRLNTEPEETLQILQVVPERDANTALRGRNLFLAEARDLKHNVSPSAKRRHSIWMQKNPTHISV